MALEQNELNRYARQISGRYETFVGAITGNFFVTLNAGSLMPRDVCAMQMRNAQELIKAKDDIFYLTMGALEYANIAGMYAVDYMASDEMLSEVAESVTNTLSAQMLRNIGLLNNEMTTLLIYASTRRNEQNISRADAVAGTIRGFKFNDRIGRKWSPHLYIDNLIKKHMVDLYVGAFDAQLDLGKSEVELSDGNIVSGQEFGAIKHQLFHPNTSIFPISIR